MPAKNSVKNYIEDSYYHVYNRGVADTKIFLDDQDYKVFLHYLEKYLDSSSQHSLAKNIKLLAYCLMPNHFHLFCLQLTKDGITKLIRALSTSYVMYFNRKYDRLGTLFQGIFKAAHIDQDSYFLHISRYIHLNPQKTTPDWRNYPYSSYSVYMGKKNVSWIDPAPVLNFFTESKNNNTILPQKHFSYKSFVEDFSTNSKDEIGELSID